ncbi:hypothetical protein GCM10028773_09610 [Spirosoma koreense]
MKFITYANWLLLVPSVLALAYFVFSRQSFASDPATRGLDRAVAIVGLIVLLMLALANFLPFRWTRITIFFLLLIPVSGSLISLLQTLATKIISSQTERKRYDGSYYFSDAEQRRLAQAIATQQLDQVRKQLQSPGLPLNGSGKDQITLLDFAGMQAVIHPDDPAALTCVELLLDKGALIEPAIPHHTPTHVLIGRGGSKALLTTLLNRGANPNATDPTNANSPLLFTLMNAYGADRIENIRLLLARGADPNGLFPADARSWLAGHTALQAAARQEYWDVCQLLLEHGADPLSVGPQHFVFTEFVNHQAALQTQLGLDVSTSFTAMQHTLGQILTKRSSKS